MADGEYLVVEDILGNRVAVSPVEIIKAASRQDEKIKVFGLTVEEIRALKDYYEMKTGEPAHTVLGRRGND